MTLILVLLMIQGSKNLFSDDFNHQFKQQEQVLESLNRDQKIGVDQYYFRKALKYLTVARSENVKNANGSWIQELLQRSKQITQELLTDSTGKTLTNKTPLVEGYSRTQKDLWELARRLKLIKGFRCAQAQVAEAEVLLLQGAYHEERFHSQKAGIEYYARASDLLIQAKRRAKYCDLDVCLRDQALKAAQLRCYDDESCGLEELSPIQLKNQAAIIPGLSNIIDDLGRIEADALFLFDQHTEAKMRELGKERLDDLITFAKKLKSTNYTIIVSGHTDRIGSNEYNDALSKKRAKQTKAYLVARGIPEDKIKTEFHGKREPIVECHKVGTSDELKECLQVNRRTEVILNYEE